MSRKHFWITYLKVLKGEIFLIQNKILDYEEICKFTDLEINKIQNKYPYAH